MQASLHITEDILSQMADQLADHGYACWDGFLHADEVSRLRQLADDSFQQGNFKQAGIGQGMGFQQNKAIRTDHIHWLDHHDADSPFHFFFVRLQELVDYLNRSCYLGIRDMEMHLAIYPTGAFYKRHLDVFKQSSGRVLSAICYLNEHWQDEDGGQLRIFFPAANPGESETHLDFSPLGGRLVFFLSDQLEHEVRPARRNRYSLTGWMKKATLL